MFISNMLCIMIGQTINWGCDVYLMVKWIVIYIYLYTVYDMHKDGICKNKYIYIYKELV